MGWVRLWQYLPGAAIDGGSQMFVFIVSVRFTRKAYRRHSELMWRSV